MQLHPKGREEGVEEKEEEDTCPRTLQGGGSSGSEGRGSDTSGGVEEDE